MSPQAKAKFTHNLSLLLVINPHSMSSAHYFSDTWFTLVWFEHQAYSSPPTQRSIRRSTLHTIGPMPRPIQLLARPPTVLSSLTPRTLPQRFAVLPTFRSASRTSALRVAIAGQSDGQRGGPLEHQARLRRSGLFHFFLEAVVELCDGGVLLDGKNVRRFQGVGDGRVG